VRRHELACRDLFALNQRREISGTAKAEIVAALAGCRTHGLRLDVGRGASDGAKGGAQGGAAPRQGQECPSIRSYVHRCLIYSIARLAGHKGILFKVVHAYASGHADPQYHQGQRAYGEVVGAVERSRALCQPDAPTARWRVVGV
jgi:hypothetical protein